jgi:hypothetical protein
MQQERSHTPLDDEARNDWFILNLLVDPDEQRPWTVDELAPRTRRPTGRDRRSGPTTWSRADPPRR